MENITISSKIDSTFEFEMTATGVDLSSSIASFQTEISSGIRYNVNCVKGEDRKWSVTIPKGLIPNGSYKFSLCVVVDEFFFEPVTGKLNVVSAEIIKVSGIPVEMEPAKEKPAKKEKVVKKDKALANENEDDGKAPIQTINTVKKIIAERAEHRDKFPFFKSKQDLAEEKFQNRKFPTIYPTELPKSVRSKIKPTTEEETKKDEVQVDDTPIEATIEVTVEAPPVVTPEVTAVKKKPVPSKRAKTKKPSTKKKEKVIEDTIDPNQRVKDILSSINNPKETPSSEIAIDVMETQEPDKFFDEIEGMKKLNERRKKIK